MTDVAFVNRRDLGGISLVVKKDGTLWYSGAVTKVNTMGMMVTSREYQKEFVKLSDSVVSASSGWFNAIYAVKNNGDLMQYTFVQVYDYGSEMIDSNGNAVPGSYHYELKEKKVLDNIQKVSSSATQVLAIKNDGSVWAWGSNSSGEIGNGKMGQGYDNDVNEPVKVLTDAKEIYAGIGFSAAIKNDASLWVWGALPDEEQQYEGGEIISGFSTTPKKIADNIKDVATNFYMQSVLKQDGTVCAWGANSVLLDSNTIKIRELPFKGYSDIQIYGTTLFMIKEDGSLWAVGNNPIWKLGIGANGISETKTPIQLTGMSNLGSSTSAVPETKTAKPTASKVLVNGKETAFNAYEINNNNYFKLRDLASVLSASGKQFDVSWDNDKQAINLLSDKAYTVVGGELAKGDNSSKTATLNTSKVYLDGNEISLTAYTIDGNNYFKLRDLGQTFDFGVGWDGAANTVTIDTSTSYTAE